MAEDWLSGRADGEGVIEGGEGYEKIIKLYCLHVRTFFCVWKSGISLQSSFDTKER